MKEWLRYFFGSFFSHRLARRGGNRSMMNGILGLLLAVALLVCGLSVGNTLSFPGFFEKAQDFQSFLQATVPAYPDLRVENGQLTGTSQINTFDDGKDDPVELIIDLRELGKTYEEFTVVGTSSQGKEVSYEEYLDLSEQIRESYTLVIRHTGKAVDLQDAAMQQKALTYLQDLAQHNENIAKSLEELEKITDDTYAEELYVLYVTVYYSEIKLQDGYGVAPTLQSYYMALAEKDPQQEYLMLFPDWCMAAFLVDEQLVTMVGYYSDLEGQSPAQNPQGFLLEGFYASGALNAVMYVFNVFSILPIVLLIWLVLALILFGLCRLRNHECGYFFFGAAQIIGSFIFICGAVTALGGAVFSFFLPQGPAYSAAVMLFYVLLVGRSLVFLTAELLNLVPEEE